VLNQTPNITFLGYDISFWCLVLSNLVKIISTRAHYHQNSGADVTHIFDIDTYYRNFAAKHWSELISSNNANARDRTCNYLFLSLRAKRQRHVRRWSLGCLNAAVRRKRSALYLREECARSGRDRGPWHM
jgi:hypothetical protein